MPRPPTTAARLAVARDICTLTNAGVTVLRMAKVLSEPMPTLAASRAVLM